MKKNLLALIPFFLLACGGEGNQTEEDTNPKEQPKVEDTTGTSWEEEDDEDKVYTASAILDGPEQWFYVMMNEEEGDVFEYDVLHIIPDDEEEKISNVAEEWMLGIIENDFWFYDPFNDFNGQVVVYYDSEKTKELCSYEAVDGKPDDEVIVYKPDGSVLINRTYELGVWVSSKKEIASVNWEFNQAESYLTINDPEFGVQEAEEGKKIITLMESVWTEKSDDNRLWTIIEKASFNNPFMVNNELMNGTLLAYFAPKGLELDMYYSLNFTDGYLDGEIMIYNDWGELDLHERFEMGELVETIYQAEYGDGMAKPIIYLYPEEEMEVEVRLNLDGRLTSTYPKYEEGWKVTAKPDGTLYDENGKEYYALYWEGEQRNHFTLDEGFVIPGEQTASFLEESLNILGLNRREANEFIVYWLPQMENNAYNLIHFSTNEYTAAAQLNITPKPESLIRVMMVYKPLDHPIDIPQQNLYDLRTERKGFTVVEWGGSEYGSKVSL